MRRHFWVVPLLSTVALAAYLFGRPATAPAEDNSPKRSFPEPSLKLPTGDYLRHQPQFIPQAGLALGRLQATVEPTVGQADPLPITQVVLYSTGVGYFQRDGQVEGDATVALTFPTADVNDLLKSMVLQDLGGGQISAVSFDSQDPVNKTLSSFAVNFADNPSYAQILNQTRGEIVTVSVGKQSNVTMVQGKVLGVETRTPKDGLPVEMLNLWCAEGMSSLPLAEVRSVQFQNAAVENEVQRALQVLAGSHDTQKKSVSLQFTGSGKRTVRVGYVVETPLWRTSYRLLAGKDGKLAIQGWAVVQNPTNEDWKDVRMALVSGRPISFQMDLYQPRYAPRPVVQPEQQASILPAIHNGTTIDAPTIEKANACGGLANIEFGNFQNPIPGSTTSIAGPAAPCLYVNTSTPCSRQTRPPGIAFDTVEASLSVMAAATASDLGDSFQYAIEHTVTIARQKSAMLPIVNKSLEGDKVSLYSPQAHARYPLLALRLKNTTALHLMQGPVAVFEDSGYCGDAQLPDLQPGEERLVSYALDLGTEVESTLTNSDPKTVSINLKKGTLAVTSVVRQTKTYVIKNRSAQDRVILVEHPIRQGYKLVSEDKPKERTRDVYRFEHKVAAGKTVAFDVVEETEVRQTEALLKCDAETIRAVLHRYVHRAPAIIQPLETVVQYQEKLKATREQLAELQKQLTNITRDQERLRANLKEMPPTADAYKRYLTKFDTQETAIEKLQQQVQELESRERQQGREYQEHLEGLELETPVSGTSLGHALQMGH